MNDILKVASEIVNGVRQEKYGDPVESFKRISEACRVVWKISVTPIEVIKIMIMIKAIRESYEHSDDNLIDIAGYLDIMERLILDKIAGGRKEEVFKDLLITDPILPKTKRYPVNE